MKFGVVFPQTEIGTDITTIRDYTQTAEEIGFDYILAYDHVLSPHSIRPEGWDLPFDHEDSFHEPFTLFSYMAGITETVEFVTGILILPQRQTALVAKQAAQLDLLSNGRLRLGIGVGESWVEFEALNKNFRNRGRRQEEQVALLQQLWTKPLVTFNGKYHTVSDAGLNPLPVQRPIPIWFGGNSDIALRRMARLGAGWIPHSHPVGKLANLLEKLRGYLAEAGREPDDFGVDYHIIMGNKSAVQIADEIFKLHELGVSHICAYTMNAGRSPSGHMAAMATFFEATRTVVNASNDGNRL